MGIVAIGAHCSSLITQEGQALRASNQGIFKTDGLSVVRIIIIIVLFFSFHVPVLISVKTGLSLWPWANVVVALRVEVALHDILLVVPIVCMCPTAWGIGNY